MTFGKTKSCYLSVFKIGVIGGFHFLNIEILIQHQSIELDPLQIEFVLIVEWPNEHKFFTCYGRICFISIHPHHFFVKRKDYF